MMKLSKQTVSREVKIVLPKLALKKPPPPNGLFKQKKSKSNRERFSGSSDKENKNSRHIILSLVPNLSLIQVEKTVDKDLRDRHSKRSKITDCDQNHLSISLKNKRKSSKYSKVDSVKIRSSAGNTIGVSRSLSINVSQLSQSVAGTGENCKDAKINGTLSPKQDKKTRRDKCSRKDSGIDVESPKKNKSTKRKYCDLLNDASNGVPEPNHFDNPVPNTVSSNGIRNFIQSYSSHRCTNKIDQEMSNAETSQAPDGSFVYRDFVIRIQQCCFNRRSEDSTSECTTSFVATTTECENIEENAEKMYRNVAVEKKIGISSRIKLGDEEKNCTRIVESEFVQTTKRSHKRIKLTEPSRMVTRRKAASNSSCEFFKLTNEKKLSFLVDSDVRKIRSNQRSQIEKGDADSKKNLKSSCKAVISKKKGFTKLQSPNNNDAEPTPSCSQSYYSSSEATVEFSSELNAIIVNSKEDTVCKKIFKDVTIYREGSPKPSTSQILQTTSSSGKKIPKRLKSKVKKAGCLDRHVNESIENPTLRKSSRIKKPLVRLSFETDVEDKNFSTWNPPKRICIKQFNAISLTKKVVVPVQKVQKSKRQNDSKLMEVKKEETPKKSDLPAKKRMKKSEALKKTERFNEHKKSLKNDGKKALSSSVKSPLPRRVTRFSSKTQNNSLVASNSKTEVNRGASCVTFSSKTPETIPRPKKEQQNSNSYECTPYILLDKLDASDISTYAITPLREDRRPMPSKSYEDYGIDDVNTDDSTDEEDHPKKVVPQWVKSHNHNAKVQYYFPRDIVRNWIRPPTTRFTVKSLFF